MGPLYPEIEELESKPKVSTTGHTKHRRNRLAGDISSVAMVLVRLSFADPSLLIFFPFVLSLLRGSKFCLMPSVDPRSSEASSPRGRTSFCLTDLGRATPRASSPSGALSSLKHSGVVWLGRLTSSQTCLLQVERLFMPLRETSGYHGILGVA